MTNLRKRMLEELQRRNYSSETIRAYCLRFMPYVRDSNFTFGGQSRDDVHPLASILVS
jgi:hypothetical protein